VLHGGGCGEPIYDWIARPRVKPVVATPALAPAIARPLGLFAAHSRRPDAIAILDRYACATTLIYWASAARNGRAWARFITLYYRFPRIAASAWPHL